MWLYWKFGKVILKTVRSVLLEANAKEIEAQRQAAIEIIRAGKEHGVDELEITMSQQAVIGFAAPIERAPIELNAGPAGRMTLKVKYKDQSRE